MKELLNVKHWDNIWQSQHFPIFKSYCEDINIHRYLKKFINRPNMSCLEVGCTPNNMYCILSYFKKNMINIRKYRFNKMNYLSAISAEKWQLMVRKVEFNSIFEKYGHNSFRNAKKGNKETIKKVIV